MSVDKNSNSGSNVGFQCLKQSLTTWGSHGSDDCKDPESEGRSRDGSDGIL